MRNNKVRIGDKVQAKGTGYFCDIKSRVHNHYQGEIFEVTLDNQCYAINTDCFKLIETLVKGDKVRCISSSLVMFKNGSTYEVSDSGCGYVQFDHDSMGTSTFKVDADFWSLFEKIYSVPIFKDIASELAGMFMDDKYWNKVYGEIHKIKTQVFNYEQEQRIKEMIRQYHDKPDQAKKAS